MNLYDEIVNQGYKIEERYSNKGYMRAYITNQSDERIGYYTELHKTKTKTVITKEPIFEEYSTGIGFEESLRFPRKINGNADRAIKELYRKFLIWKETETLNKDFEESITQLLKIKSN
ncbi:MAG: hypothetical protein JHC54_02560 [Acinetobacter sp.]|nr:hypothetical protein [Acinetobacter sp.]